MITTVFAQDEKTGRGITLDGEDPGMMKKGECFTMEGYHDRVPNPERKFWQLWKPKTVTGPLTVFTVTDIV